MPSPTQRTLHPIIRPAVEHESVNAPVRDDDALGPTEDLDREPDGMPHAVIGLLALFSVVLAVLVGFMFLAGGSVTRVAGVVLVLLAIPVLVSTLRRRADRDRDQLHPSR
jgi:Flp pilus assembly protein TadB